MNRTTNREILDISESDYFKMHDHVSRSAIRDITVDGEMVYNERYNLGTLPFKKSDAMRLGSFFHASMAYKQDVGNHYYTIPRVIQDDSVRDRLLVDQFEWFSDEDTNRDLGFNLDGKLTQAKIINAKRPDRLRKLFYHRDYYNKYLSRCSKALSKTKKYDPKSAKIDVGTTISLRTAWHKRYQRMHKILSSLQGKEWIDEKDIQKTVKMIESVYENPGTHEYINQKHPCEVVGTAVDTVTGLKIKAMADILTPDTIIDFKTTKETTSKAFIKSAIYNYGYHFQAEWYTRVFGVKNFIIITVRNNRPYESMIYNLTDPDDPEMVDRLQEARELNDAALDQISAAKEFNSWHSDGFGGIIPLKVGKQ